MYKKKLFIILFPVFIVFFGVLVYWERVSHPSQAVENNINNNATKQQNDNIMPVPKEIAENISVNSNMTEQDQPQENKNSKKTNAEQSDSSSQNSPPGDNSTEIRTLITNARGNIDSGYDLAGNGKFSESYQQFLAANNLFLEAKVKNHEENSNLANALENYILEADNLTKAFTGGNLQPNTNLLLKNAAYYKNIADHYFNL